MAKNQVLSDQGLSPRWNASWIGPANDPRQDEGVFVFSHRLALDADPQTFPVRVSADQRYKLYVNGQMVAFGPQRGDIMHWFYETLDLAPFLHAGDNAIVAVVWNFGRWAPMAQITVRTGFAFECLVPGFDSANTKGDWQIAKLPGWDYAMMHSEERRDFYIDVGPGEIVDGRLLPAGWTLGQGLDFGSAHGIASAEGRGALSGGTPWNLTPRSIPPMRYDDTGIVPDIRTPDGGRISVGETVDLASGSPLILDYRELLCAYPRLTLRGEPGTTVTLTYAEAPSGEHNNDKAHRDEVRGKKIRGYQDRLILGEGPLTFEPLWWRTYRYLQIETDGPARLESIRAVETGYPYQVESRFDADDPWVPKIWDVGVRTLKRCAGETYFDCPYYEQLQYAGDTRIQALAHYYLSRDRALPRNAVENFSWSFMDSGLTQSRYPSRQPQVIPPFSLWWILMMYDQMLYDAVPVDHLKVEHAHSVIRAWRGLTRGDQERTFWCFGDWQPEWPWGVPPGGALSSIHLLTKLMARVALSDLLVEHPFAAATAHSDDLAQSFLEDTHHLHHAKRAQDEPPTEHVEALYRVAQMMVGQRPDAWPEAELQEIGATPTSLYFSYYKHLAKKSADYLAELDQWKEQIENGLTTFIEHAEPVRSDCHAWSAHPVLGFFQFIAGVTSVSNAWRKAKIEPHPGSLKRFEARIAHPLGDLLVVWDGKSYLVDSPVPFTFVQGTKVEDFREGRHTVVVG